ncbi:MAG: competence/damage-inducible protein A [Clostridia bacterium]|nr:competence/damage-inducible protein A [Clostridia bacterium]
MIAEILSVGTELLLGDIVDTNSQYLSQKLSAMGIDVYYRSCVGDNKLRMMDTLHLALSRSDIVLITGGLGPTMDDITRECVAEAFDLPMEQDVIAAEMIRARYSKTGKQMPDNALKQAYVPQGSVVFQNSCGTAPGSATQKGDKTIIVMPGPPHEMHAMFEESVQPYLLHEDMETIHSRTLRIFGVGEPVLEEKIRDLLIVQTNPTIGIYVGFGEARIRISAKAKNADEAEALIAPVADALYAKLGDLIYGEGETTMAEVVANLLIDKNKTVATAESCTGGMIASALVGVPGVSQSFMEGHVTYSNEAKMRILGVKDETLAAHGAVSTQTACEMAEGLKRISGADYALSVTGIAGPGGGTPEKPVGLVYIGFCDENGPVASKYLFDGERQRVRQLSMLNALNQLRLALQKN